MPEQPSPATADDARVDPRRRRRLPVMVALGVGAAIVGALTLAVSGVLAVNAARPASSAYPAVSDPAASDPAAADPAGSAPSPTGPLRIVALGDSVASGWGCDCVGFVEQTGELVGTSTGRAVTVTNLSVPGWTSADAVDALADPGTLAAARAADVVLIEVGANDIDVDRLSDPGCLPVATSPCWASALVSLRDNLTRLVDLIGPTSPQHTIVFVDYWNITVDGDVAQELGEDFQSGSDELTTEVNTVIRSVAATQGAPWVGLRPVFDGADGTRDPTGDLQEDGDHPNASGHALIARAVLPVVLAAVQRPDPGTH